MPDCVSDSDSDSDSDYEYDFDYESDSCDVSEFLKAFPTYHLHKKPVSYDNLYVFDRQDEGGGSQNNSSSAHRQTTGTIQDKIKSALSSTKAICVNDLVILQFWAPVENGGRRLLSTSDQPFAVNRLDKDLIKYRQQCTEYEYDMVVNYRQDGEEDEHSNPSGPPATAFLNRLPHIVDISRDTRDTLTQYALESDLRSSFMLPICGPSQTSSPCVGVIQCSSASSFLIYNRLPQTINDVLKKEGLSIFDVQERIPYKILHGLRPVRDKIRYVIERLSKSHKLMVAQVWIAHHEDKNQVPFLSSFEYAQKKHMLALKLTGYWDTDFFFKIISLKEYYDLCDMFPLDTGESLVEKTLQDYKSRFYTTYDRLNKNQKRLDVFNQAEVNGIVICLKSTDTGDFGYAFEFFWKVKSDYGFSLENLLLALKGLLPSFKFASNAELGDELHVIDVENSTESDIRSLKIFEGKGISILPKAPEEGKKQVVVKDMTHLEMNCESAPIDIHGEDIELQFEKTQKEATKNIEDVGNSIKRDSKRKKPAVVEDKESLKAKQKTAPIELPYAEIEKRFGKTQSEAAKDLNVSLSTLKRHCKKYGIYEWQGPKPGKKKVNHFRNQSGTIEEDTGAILVPLSLERNENNLTIKAEDSNGSNDMIRFELPMSEVTFKSVEKEIVKEFDLIPGTYKIKYCDKEEDWILLTPNYDMNYCIRSSKDSHKNIIRLRVQRVSSSS